MQSRLATLVALVASVAALPAHKLDKKGDTKTLSPNQARSHDSPRA